MKKTYSTLIFFLLYISLAASAWYLGRGVLVGFDDISHFINDFSRYFEHYSYRYLIPSLLSLAFASFFGFIILRFVNNNNIEIKRKLIIWLPIAGIIISITNALLLIIYGFIIYQINPSTSGEFGIGLVLTLMFIIPLGGIILTILLGIIGLLIDRAILKKKISSILNLLKVLIITFTLIIILSFVINAINSFKIGCSPSDNKCLLGKAISEQDPNTCDKSDWCYMRYYETQNSSVCASMPDKVDTLGGGVIFYNYRDKCYEYFAYKENNADLCDLIKEQRFRKSCLNDI